MTTFTCPRCSRMVSPCGRAYVGESVMPVYQCGDCTDTALVFGEPFPIAYTFVVGPDGFVLDLDPAHPERSRIPKPGSN